ncbi:MAG: hypothetical protein AB3N28_05515 [Kordiimonas sp.]
MTISHILILFIFIVLGSAGIASAQEGLSTIWQHMIGKLPTPKATVKHSSKMRIV